MSQHKMLWKSSNTTPNAIITRAKDNLHEWRYMKMAKHRAHMVPTDEVSWTKPPPNSLKCYVDCTLFANNSIAGYGVCFRDSNGHFIYGKSSWK
jgi:hypothetical protein